MLNTPLKIYLAGYIEFNADRTQLMPECTEWRKYIREFYQQYKTHTGEVLDYGLQFFDPLIGESSEHMLSDALIFGKDYLSIKNCDVIISNFKTFNKPDQNVRPPLGTILEVGIAYEMKKTLIAITDDPRYINHPFIQRMFSAIYPDVETLCKSKALNILFKSINTSLY